MKIENAVIESTFLGYEDHGILTAFVHVKGPGWGCGFGGYALDSYDKATKKRVGVAFGIAFVAAVLKTVGVDSWEKLAGKHVRVETDGWGGGISRLGNILEDKWFDPKELVESMQETHV